LWFTATGALICVSLAIPFLLASSYAVHVFADILQLLLLVSGYLLTVPNQVPYRGRAAAFWTLMSLGFALWILNQALWTFYETVLHQAPTPGFWGDIVLFLHPIPFMMALAVRPHLAKTQSPGRLNAANAALVLVWWAYLYMYFVGAWQYISPDTENYNQYFNLVYGAANLGTAALAALSFLHSRGKWRILYAHILGAASLYVVASYLASAAIDRGVYYSGGMYDVPLVAAMAWFAGIGLVGRELRPSAEPSQANTDTIASWLALGAIAVVLGVEIRGLFVVVPASVASFRMLLSIGTITLLGILFVLRRNLIRNSGETRAPKGILDRLGA